MANNDLFASLVSDIKSYNGKDPLLPWIRGIRKMKGSLPPQVLKEKLPRFLQKCAQTFESDRRYRNDLRYLRVWLHLMDYVDDPRALLKAMESNDIGTKHSLFYQAYALYYEKSKKFDEAEKMYHLGIQNLAEPGDELQKSFEQFLRRCGKRRKKRLERTNRYQSDKNKDDECLPQMDEEVLEGSSKHVKPLIESYQTDSGHRNKCQEIVERGSDKRSLLCGDDTVMVKFVGTAIDGRSEAENACHHGLVEPTINMKEAMDAINSMFSEPLDSFPVARSHQTRPENDGKPNNGFAVFVDEDCDNGVKQTRANRVDCHRPHQEPLSIFIDDEEENNRTEDENLAGIFISRENRSSVSHGNVFVFPTPKDLPSESSDDMDVEGPSRPRFREDTVVRRFVGSAILDEPVVENVCHHGLVDPTINLKEAMDDINSMFGKPIDFVRSKRSKKPVKETDMKSNFGGGFTVLADDDLEHEPVKPINPKSSRKSRGCDLFEPTMVTKEALDDINKMFGMPLDY